MRGGMVYNGFDFGPYLRVNPHRGILPPVSVTTDEVPGRAGARFRAARLGELTIEVDAELRAGRGDDIAELRHIIAHRLWSPEPAKLVLPDDPFRYHMAVLDGESELDRLWGTGQATLTFRCPDPIAYGSDRSAALDGESEVWVGGSYPTPPTIEAVPAGKNLRVESATASAVIEVAAEGAFDGTKTLTIDCGAGHCELAGLSADSRVTLASDYFELSPGANLIRIEGGAGTISWTERWL